MSLIITKKFKRAKALDSIAMDAKFKKGDKVVSVKTGAQGVVNEVYGEEKYAVLFNGAANPDRVEGFQIRLANSRAADACGKGEDAGVPNDLLFAVGAIENAIERFSKTFSRYEDNLGEKDFKRYNAIFDAAVNMHRAIQSA